MTRLAKLLDVQRRLAKLLDVQRMLLTGPASFEHPYPFDDLTKAQREKVSYAFHLWADTWILPTIDAEIERLRDEQARRKA